MLFYHSCHKHIKQHNLFNSFNIDNFTKEIIINVSWAVYQTDFWRSCDTEDWSNDAESSALDLRNKLHLKVYSNRKVILNCDFHNITVLLYFESNKCSLCEQNKKFYWP